MKEFLGTIIDIENTSWNQIHSLINVVEERTFHLIDEIERSQDLFKLAKPAFWGFSVSSTSHHLQSYYCSHKYMSSPVVLSFFLCLSLGVRTKIGRRCTIIQAGVKSGSGQLNIFWFVLIWKIYSSGRQCRLPLSIKHSSTSKMNPQIARPQHIISPMPLLLRHITKRVPYSFL